MLNGYRYDRNWTQSVGQLIGYGNSHVSPFGGEKTTYCIPLYLLSDFFGYGRLLPSMIMSGLRIEIEFETSARAFIHSATSEAADVDARYNHARATAAEDVQVTSTPNGDQSADLGPYTIHDITIVAKSVQLTDATQRALNELSATNGLEIVYTDFERTETQFSSSGKIHVEVRKACSRALQAYARIRLTKTLDLGKNYEQTMGDEQWAALTPGAVAPTNTVAGGYLERHFDSFASEPLSQVLSYQWQLGSLYFPQQPVKGEDHMTVARAGYAQTLIALGKFAPNRSRPDTAFAIVGDTIRDGIVSAAEQSVSGVHAAVLDKYKFDRAAGSKSRNQLYEPVVAQGEPGTFVSYGQTWVVALERSSLFELAGVPINNSRVLALRMELDKTVDRTVDVYLKYVKLARVFLNNVEVEQ
jgi:hypothetical protein